MKRGGGAEHLPLAADSSEDTEGEMPVADVSAASADVMFDRQWATTIVGRAVDRLGREFAAEGKERQFDALKTSLLGKGDAVSYVEVGRGLGMSEAAIKVAVHRLRKRFREALSAEIAETLNDRGQVDEEMRSLFAALG